jgi:hypothetical protein
MANTLNNWASAFSSAMLGVASWLNGRKQKVTGDATATTQVGSFLTSLFGGASNVVTDTANNVSSSVSSVVEDVKNGKNKSLLFILLGAMILLFWKPISKVFKKTPKRRRRVARPAVRRSSKARMPKGTRSAKARMAYVRSFRKKRK